LTLPDSGVVYADAQIFIYSLEAHPTFGPLCTALWDSVQAGRLRVVTSELTVMETLVFPLRAGDAQAASDYEQFFEEPGIVLVPISAVVLREAAQLRAAYRSLRTPDAIHAATALQSSAATFLTNDKSLRQVAGLATLILDDAAYSP
jgi:predicted nucleic acid-binding protein